MSSGPGKSGPARIMVAGPPNSGVSTVATALAAALPDDHVVEWIAPRGCETPDTPVVAAVVFVVTAAAPMTPSQVALLESVLGVAGRVAVVVAVSKIDLHRGWADVLEVNRRMWAADRVVPGWVGVAADPDVGEPRMEDLIDALRNRAACCAPPEIRAARPGERLGNRSEMIARRGEVAQTRLRLSGMIRAGFAELRAELHRQAGRLERRGLSDFREQTLVRIAAAVTEWDETLTSEFDAIMRSSGVDVRGLHAEPVPRVAARPPEAADPTEVRLTVLIGAMFGVGAALTVSRLLSDLGGVWTSAAGAVVGIGLALWVIGSRLLLSERAAMLRWTADVLAGARQTLEERVASRALAAEVAMGLAAADRR